MTVQIILQHTLQSLYTVLEHHRFVVLKLWVMLNFQHHCKTKTTTEQREGMSDRSLLPCLWTKTNPDSTWNMMFLISFSENILFSLSAKQRDRKERKKKEGNTKLNKEKSWKVHLFWMCGSVGRACEAKKKQAGCQSVWITNVLVWLSFCVICLRFFAMQNPHNHYRKACQE